MFMIDHKHSTTASIDCRLLGRQHDRKLPNSVRDPRAVGLHRRAGKRTDKGKEFLQHTRERQPPFVPPADVEAEERRALERKDKAKRRRGGVGVVAAPLAPETIAEEEEKKKRIQHAVCRGFVA